MSSFLLRRLIGSLVVLAVLSFVVYALIGLMPGDPIDIMIAADPNLTPADSERLRRVYGLDLPIWERYWHWLTAALGGDLGYSRTYNRPVLDILAPRLGSTLVLLGLSSVLAMAIALPLGIVAALRPHGAVDNAVNLFCFAGISLPPFWLALLMILLFAVGLGWLPAGGMAPLDGGPEGFWAGLAAKARFLVLPVATLTNWIRREEKEPYGPAVVICMEIVAGVEAWSDVLTHRITTAKRHHPDGRSLRSVELGDPV